MSSWLLLVSLAFAGKCEQTAQTLVTDAEFEAGFRGSMVGTVRGGFIQGLRSAGAPEGPFLQFAADYWTPLLEAELEGAYGQMLPALEEWVVGAVGCKRLKQLGKQKPFPGWMAVTSEEQLRLQQTAPTLTQHESMTAVMAGVTEMIDTERPKFEAAAAAAGVLPQ